jgi:LuxR family maltose regulon positive regulatory protein
MRGSVLQTAGGSKMASAGTAGNILDQLTEQEKKVLELIAAAATNQEIGEKLGISLPTVKRHTGNIYGKLGIKNRTQCIKLIRELGLL